MSRKLDIAKMLVMALVAVTLVGVLTPVCAMADCDDTSAGACSNFQPACDDCPDSIVMRHTHDDAVSVAAPQLDQPVAVATISTFAGPEVVSLALSAPAVTASPPPLDPLGVRLTV